MVSFNMKKALIIDDMEVSRLHLQALLNKFRFECELVESAEAGIQKMELQEFDILIVDWHMPDMDGVKLIKNIRGASDNGDMVIILFSGVEEEKGMAVAEEIGADGFLSKPITLDMINSKLQQMKLI